MGPPTATTVAWVEPETAPNRVQVVATVTARYMATLSDDRQHLLRRYVFADTARKVVGVGSVGLDARIAWRDDISQYYLAVEANPVSLPPLLIQNKRFDGCLRPDLKATSI